MFSGIWLPIVTPLRNGEVDIDAQQRLADYYLRTEISGFVALSTTGEAALLQEAERLTILQPLTEVVGSRLPMLIGVGGGGSATHTRIDSGEQRRGGRQSKAAFKPANAPSFCTSISSISA